MSTESPKPNGNSNEVQESGFQLNLNEAVNLAQGLLGNNVLASASSGEMTFIQSSTAGLGLPDSNVDPFRYLFDGIVRIVSGLKNALGNKKHLLRVIILAFLWLVLAILPALGVFSPVFTFLNFFTFAQGGLGNGLTGIIGGTIGKGVFAYFLFSIIMPGKGAKVFLGVGVGVKKMFGSLMVKNTKMLALTLFGISSALLVYKFLTGDPSLQNSMVGIAAFFISARALANKAGFLRGFINSLFMKLFTNLAGDIANVNRLIAGWTAGFGFAVLLSALGLGVIGGLLGGLALIVAIILALVSKKGKEVAVK